ncbi:MAG: preprotein translocase subunit SecE [Candidatus Saccharibacteria bacterium]|nr:preprotein translocase subunit SecE [Candidatus Saccharibacteria bacterium]
MASGNKKVVRRVKAKVNDSTTTDNVKVVSTKPTASNVAKTNATKDSKPAKRKGDAKVVKASAKSRKVFVIFRPFVAISRYIRDSWRELRRVEWPSRRATWKMTLGVILFCVFIGAFILICDWASQWLIQEVIL